MNEYLPKMLMNISLTTLSYRISSILNRSTYILHQRADHSQQLSHLIHFKQVNLQTTPNKQTIVSSYHILSISNRLIYSLHQQVNHGQQLSHLIHIKQVNLHPTPTSRPQSAIIASHPSQIGQLTNYTNKQTTVSCYRISSISNRLIYPLHQQADHGQQLSHLIYFK